MQFKKNQILTWAIIGFALFFLYNSIIGFSGGMGSKTISINDFNDLIKNKGFREITVTPVAVIGEISDGTKVRSPITVFYTNNIIEKALESEIKTNIVLDTTSPMSKFFSLILSWLPTLLLIGVWVYFMTRSSGGAGGSPSKMFGFGKSKAKMIMPNDIKVRMKDVAGIDESKAELQEIIDFLKEPKRYIRLGAKIPKGCLLSGSPGTGKTLLAKAIAGEAKVPFFSISGSDFVEMFVGVGASRVREMFAEAKKNAPCIVFIDEIDAVGRQRGSGVGGGNDEREQTLNQLLVEMDGFEDNLGVVVIAATNRPDVLDKALLRPGRFDRQVAISKPDILGREQVLKVHVANIKTGPDVEVKTIARGTPGFSGAELANLVNEAALIAGRANKHIVSMEDFELAKDKILLGLERKNMVMKDEEKRLTAYHEGGHAICSIYSKGSDPIHKATILPRGRALGVVMRFPLEDKFSMTRENMMADLTVAMGGRAAEELVFGYDKVTSGAMSDIRQVTALASAMVREWGMSDEVGPVYHGINENNPYVKDISSEEINRVVEKEIKRLVTEAIARAKQILTDNRDKLETLANALLKYETLSGEEIRQILAGETIEKDVLFSQAGSKTEEITDTTPQSSFKNNV
jgi:cell division protease FtsH